jgi:hypothetical protein
MGQQHYRSNPKAREGTSRETTLRGKEKYQGASKGTVPRKPREGTLLLTDTTCYHISLKTGRVIFNTYSCS